MAITYEDEAPAKPKITYEERRATEPSAFDKVSSAVKNVAQIASPGALISSAANYGLSKGAQLLDHLGYGAGGYVTDKAAPYVPPEVAAGLGTAANLAVQTVPSMVAGNMAGRAAPMVSSAAENLMRRSLKAPLSALESGDAQKAARTMLDEGVSLTSGGSNKLQNNINGLNSQIDSAITKSPATINVDDVVKRADPVVSSIRHQIGGAPDLASARKIIEEFKNGELFASLGEREKKITEALLTKTASKQAALQEAGKFVTELEQQKNLSNKFFPVEGQPRIAARYSNNADRIPEATGGYSDALAIYGQRKKEEEFLARVLESLPANERAGNIPVQLAQEMKKATYRKLGDKAYDIGLKPAAERDTIKALNRGMKEEIATAVPEVGPLNARESQLLNALDLMERRRLLAGNHNVLGLAPVAPNTSSMLSFLVDRSPAAMSMLARAMNHNARGLTMGAGAIPAALGTAASNMPSTASPLETQSILADILRRQQQ